MNLLFILLTSTVFIFTSCNSGVDLKDAYKASMIRIYEAVGDPREQFNLEEYVKAGKGFDGKKPGVLPSIYSINYNGDGYEGEVHFAKIIPHTKTFKRSFIKEIAITFDKKKPKEEVEKFIKYLEALLKVKPVVTYKDPIGKGHPERFQFGSVGEGVTFYNWSDRTPKLVIKGQLGVKLFWIEFTSKFKHFDEV